MEHWLYFYISFPRKLDKVSVDIIVKKLPSEWRAYLADNHRIWEAGKSAVEAIGKLVISADNYLGITVIKRK